MSAGAKKMVLTELKALSVKAEAGEQWSSTFAGVNMQHESAETQKQIRKYLNLAIKAVKAAR